MVIDGLDHPDCVFVLWTIFFMAIKATTTTMGSGGTLFPIANWPKKPPTTIGGPKTRAYENGGKFESITIIG